MERSAQTVRFDLMKRHYPGADHCSLPSEAIDDVRAWVVAALI
jgi:hypothetical protein